MAKVLVEQAYIEGLKLRIFELECLCDSLQFDAMVRSEEGIDNRQIEAKELIIDGLKRIRVVQEEYIDWLTMLVESNEKSPS